MARLVRLVRLDRMAEEGMTQEQQIDALVTAVRELALRIAYLAGVEPETGGTAEPAFRFDRDGTPMVPLPQELGDGD